MQLLCCLSLQHPETSGVTFSTGTPRSPHGDSATANTVQTLATHYTCSLAPLLHPTLRSQTPPTGSLWESNGSSHPTPPATNFCSPQPSQLSTSSSILTSPWIHLCLTPTSPFRKYCRLHLQKRARVSQSSSTLISLLTVSLLLQSPPPPSPQRKPGGPCELCFGSHLSLLKALLWLHLTRRQSPHHGPQGPRTPALPPV